jgi:hypothetical protein
VLARGQLPHDFGRLVGRTQVIADQETNAAGPAADGRPALSQGLVHGKPRRFQGIPAGTEILAAEGGHKAQAHFRDIRTETGGHGQDSQARHEHDPEDG